MSLIKLNDFSFSYPGCENAALRNISLSIEEGSFVALIGANNAGKSSLCYSLAGIIPHCYNGTMDGSLQICGHNVHDVTVADLSTSVGLVMQKPEHQLSGLRFTVFEEVAFNLENHGVERDEIGKRVIDALHLVGMAHFADRSPHHLSGGQLQKVILAAAFVSKPRVLVLDEPTTFLDPQATRQVFEILQHLRRNKTTIVLAEQRLEWIALYADRVIALHNGEIVLDGTPDDVLISPRLEDIGLCCTRFTAVSKVAQTRKIWPSSRSLAITCSQTIEGLDIGTSNEN